MFQIPYVLTATDSLSISTPFDIPGGATSQIQSYDGKVSVVTVGAAESLPNYTVSSWSELMLTLSWGNSMWSPIARGSPYVTMEYNGATPSINSPQSLVAAHSITVDGKPTPCDGAHHISGKVLEFSFIESDSSWALYSPSTVSWNCSATPFSLVASAPLSGAIRLAEANNCTSGAGAHHCSDAPKGRNTSEYTALLSAHAGNYPTSGRVQTSVSSGTVQLNFSWNSSQLWPTTTAEPLQQQSNDLLMLSLLHHRKHFTASTAAKGLPALMVQWSIRGIAAPVVADSWSMQYADPQIGFSAPRDIDPSMKDAIKAALLTSGNYNGSSADVDYDLPFNYQIGAGDTYFSGKMLARMAQLALIADLVGETSAAKTLVARLADRVTVWLSDKSKNRFLYDQLWGGIVACGCNYDNCKGKCEPKCDNDPTGPSCPALSDAGQNFGNGYYNDHHFHYGYIVYAAAVVAKFDAAWAAKHYEQVLVLIRDYGNPSANDQYFPVARCKDFFMSFSWASGITTAGDQPYQNGRNQESTSEAVNAYYAMQLFGSAVHGHANNSSLETIPAEWRDTDARQAVTDSAQAVHEFGRVLLAMEVDGADTYWHQIPGDQAVYKTYNKSVVGIVWTHLVQFGTWFGAAPYEVHGIQQLPYTPASESLLPKPWVELEFPEFAAGCGSDCGTAGWSWLVCLEQAILDTDKAVECIHSLPTDAFTNDSPGSNGQSLTAALYWISTRAK